MSHGGKTDTVTVHQVELVELDWAPVQGAESTVKNKPVCFNYPLKGNFETASSVAPCTPTVWAIILQSPLASGVSQPGVFTLPTFGG